MASFMVDEDAWRQFRTLCDAASETPDTALRELVRLEIQRRTRRKTRRSEAPDEELLGRLRLLVAEALNAANDWHGYRKALRSRGLDIAPKGGGLVLLAHPSRCELAKHSQVGPGYLKLVRRFGTQLPGHAALARFPLRKAPRAGEVTEPF